MMEMRSGFNKVLELLSTKYGNFKSSDNPHLPGWKFKDFTLLQTTWYGAVHYVPNKSVCNLLKHLGDNNAGITLFAWKAETDDLYKNVKTPEKAFKIIDNYHTTLKTLLNKAGE